MLQIAIKPRSLAPLEVFGQAKTEKRILQCTRCTVFHPLAKTKCLVCVPCAAYLQVIITDYCEKRRTLMDREKLSFGCEI